MFLIVLKLEGKNKIKDMKMEKTHRYIYFNKMMRNIN